MARDFDTGGGEAPASPEIEIVEKALAAARDAMEGLSRLLKHLNGARKWGFLDMFGGGLLTTWTKHKRIDAAKVEAARVRHLLWKLAQALNSLGRQGPERNSVRVEIGEMERYIDYCCDNLYGDWYVQKRIESSIQLARRAQSVITRHIKELFQVKKTLEGR